MIKNSLKSPFLVLTKDHLCSRRKTKILLKERFYTQKQKNLKLDELNDENFLGEVVKRFCQHWLKEKMSSYLFSFLLTNGQKIKEAKEKLGILEFLFPQDRGKSFNPNILMAPEKRKSPGYFFNEDLH